MSMKSRPANSHTRFPCNSHGLTTTQANLTGSSLRRVNTGINAILMMCVTPISYLNERKMRLGVGNGHQILLNADVGCVSMTPNRAYTSCESDTG